MDVDEQTLQEIERQLTVLGQRFDQLRHVAAARWGLGLEKAALRILGRLVDHGPQRATEVAACFGLDESTVSRQIDVLVSTGLVERERDPADRRAYLLRPTAAGQRYLAEARRGRRDFLTAVLADWSLREQEALGELLARLNADLERASARTFKTALGRSVPGEES